MIYSKDTWDMRFHKRFIQVGKDEKKNEDLSTKEIQSNWERWGKENQESFHQRKNVQSSQEKWKCIRKNENS